MRRVAVDAAKGLEIELPDELPSRRPHRLYGQGKANVPGTEAVHRHGVGPLVDAIAVTLALGVLAGVETPRHLVRPVYRDGLGQAGVERRGEPIGPDDALGAKVGDLANGV